MNMQAKVLLAGGSWVSTSTHFKRFDFFSTAYYEVGSAYYSVRVYLIKFKIVIWQDDIGLSLDET